MNTAKSKSIHRSWYWLTLVPLICGASFALLNYAFWASAHGAWYGLPSYASQTNEAGRNAHLYWWMLVGLGGTATIVATILIPPFKSDSLPVGLKEVIRFGLAVALVVSSIFIVAYGLQAAGHYLK
jgi:hypothetical protein